jgi:hypothetical protein
MKRALAPIAKKRITYGVRELSAKKVATELRNHCARELQGHYAFESVSAVRKLAQTPGVLDYGYRFVIVSRNKYGGMTQAFVLVKPNLSMTIETNDADAYEDGKFPADMLDCLLSAGEKAFR